MSQNDEKIVDVKVPDIGDYKNVPVIEIAVKVGDTVKVDDSLITVESDKATLDVPTPVAGVVSEIAVKMGDPVSEGTLVVRIRASGEPGVSTADAASTSVAPPAAAVPPAAPVVASAPAAAPPARAALATALDTRPSNDLSGVPPRYTMPTPGELAAEAVGGHSAHASPSVRRFARDLGVDVARVKGTGPKNRILHGDVQAYVKAVMSGAVGTPGAAAGVAPMAGGVGLNLLPWPSVDFAKFGPVEVKPLSRIQKLSGPNLARNWVMIPHVTQFDEADITDLDAFRVAMNKEAEKGGGAKLTMLAFLIKACAAALKKFPTFNASLDGDTLVLKQYYHIGFAADTPKGLVVPVLRDADKKGFGEIAGEMAELAKKARDGKLSPAGMQGGCFTISSLGGIGGTAFTPIINAPEVAILGVSRTQTKPVWNGQSFVPRQMLPLSLSYDHRVIDGASAARFTTYLTQLLADMRRSLL